MQATQSRTIVALLLALGATTACVGNDASSIDPEGTAYQAATNERKPKHDLAVATDFASPRDLAEPKDLAPSNPCMTGPFCATLIADQTLDLMTSATATFQVLSSSAYSGTVNLSVQRPALDALSGGQEPDVDISLAPAVVSLVGGVPQTVTITITTTTAAAAFNALPFNVHLADAKDSSKVFDVQVHLTVNPTLTIGFDGDGLVNKHHWATDRGALINFQIRQRPVVAGTGGTTLVFLNNSTNLHIIHGSGKITHQSPAGTGIPPHGTYTVFGVNDTAAMQANGFYCHTHSSAQSDPPGPRMVTFVP